MLRRRSTVKTCATPGAGESAMSGCRPSQNPSYFVIKSHEGLLPTGPILDIDHLTLSQPPPGGGSSHRPVLGDSVSDPATQADAAASAVEKAAEGSLEFMELKEQAATEADDPIRGVGTMKLREVVDATLPLSEGSRPPCGIRMLLDIPVD